MRVNTNNSKNLSVWCCLIQLNPYKTDKQRNFSFNVIVVVVVLFIPTGAQYQMNYDMKSHN